MLLRAACDPNAEAADGLTALGKALAAGADDAVRVLLQWTMPDRAEYRSALQWFLSQQAIANPNTHTNTDSHSTNKVDPGFNPGLLATPLYHNSHPKQ